MDILNGIRPGKCELHQEHRGSRMPEHMASVVWPEPDAEAIEEKEEG